MACCKVTKCCCGCISLKVGIGIWAILDAIFQITAGALSITVLKIEYVHGSIWVFILGIADLLLAFAAFKNKATLILAWQILMLIHTISLYILWILFPIWVVKPPYYLIFS